MELALIIDVVWPLISSTLIFLPIVLCIVWLTRPGTRHYLSFLVLKRVLLKRLNSNLYQIFSRVSLHTRDGTSQIKFVVLSRYGLFALHTVERQGRITGGKRKVLWNQRLGSKLSSFKNPLFRSFIHAQALRSALELPKGKVKDVVVFHRDVHLVGDIPENVGTLEQSLRYILSFKTRVFSDAEVTHLAKLLSRGRLKPRPEFIQVYKEEVALLEPHTEARMPSCPECDGPMQLHTNSSSGETYLVCQRYPRCRGRREAA